MVNQIERQQEERKKNSFTELCSSGVYELRESLLLFSTFSCVILCDLLAKRAKRERDRVRKREKELGGGEKKAGEEEE